MLLLQDFSSEVFVCALLINCDIASDDDLTLVMHGCVAVSCDTSCVLGIILFLCYGILISSYLMWSSCADIAKSDGIHVGSLLWY